jgi:hypothetical protein
MHNGVKYPGLKEKFLLNQYKTRPSMGVKLSIITSHTIPLTLLQSCRRMGGSQGKRIKIM